MEYRRSEPGARSCAQVLHFCCKSAVSSSVQPVLVVAATAAELAFVEGAETFCCGIGPIEASLQTMRALVERKPSAVLHIGIAGARSVEPPALVLGSESVYCDLVDPTFTLPRFERQTPDSTMLSVATAALADAHVLPIATSARVGGGSCCDVEAMEGFGILRAAALAGVPAIELRAVSNAVGEIDRSKWRIREALAALAGAVPVLIEAMLRA
jgi:futalosine hydrolase